MTLTLENKTRAVQAPGFVHPHNDFLSLLEQEQDLVVIPSRQTPTTAPTMSSGIDLAQELVRSVVRAFYVPADVDTRHIVIVDALIIHSALRDDDLSYLLGQNNKDMKKLCANYSKRMRIQESTTPKISPLTAGLSNISLGRWPRS